MAKRTIETDLKLTGEKEFNQQMKALNNGLKTTKSDMAALSAEFDDNANSAKALSAKNKLLQSSVAQHKEKVEALRKQYEAAAATLGENEATTQKYKQQLNQATVALKKETDALEDNQKALRKRYLAGLELLGSGSKKALSGLGNLAGATAKGTLTVAGGAAKGIGAISAASVAGVAALGVGAVAILAKMTSFAKEAADAAKAAKEAGQPLTEDQKKWLAFSEQLDTLDASVQSAKTALGNVLLPVLSELAGKGASFLTEFSADLDAAAGDTEQQGQVIAKYIVRLAKDIMAELPEFVEVGKSLIAGIGSGLRENGEFLIDSAFSLLMDLLNFVFEFAPELASSAIDLVEQLCQGLTDQGAAQELIFAAVGMVSDILVGLAQAAPDLIPMAVQLVGTLLTALVAASPDLILAGLELVFGIIQGIFNSFDDIENAVVQIIETAKEAFGDKADEFKQIGRKIINLLKEGVEDAWQAFSKWVTDLWDNLFGDKNVNVNVNGITESDSVDGSAFGGLRYVPFDNYLARLHQGEMVLTRAEADAYRNGASAGGQKTVNLYFSATTITEADVNMVVDIVNRKLGEAM